MNTQHNTSKIKDGQELNLLYCSDFEIKELFSEMNGENKLYKYEWVMIPIGHILKDISKKLNDSIFWNEKESAMLDRLFKLRMNGARLDDEGFIKVIFKQNGSSFVDILLVKYKEV